MGSCSATIKEEGEKVQNASSVFISDHFWDRNTTCRICPVLNRNIFLVPFLDTWIWDKQTSEPELPPAPCLMVPDEVLPPHSPVTEGTAETDAGASSVEELFDLRFFFTASELFSAADFFLAVFLGDGGCSDPFFAWDASAGASSAEARGSYEATRKETFRRADVGQDTS